MDLTRLVSRVGQRRLTGIDRVELVYLRRLAKEKQPLFLMVRIKRRFFLLDAEGAAILKTSIDRTLADDVQSDLGGIVASLAIDHAIFPRLSRMLGRNLPVGTSFVNVGHQNLTGRYLRAIRHIPGAHLAIMIHDTIPLELPDMQPRGMARKFARKLRAAAKYAHLLIFNSVATEKDVRGHLAKMGVPCPESKTVHFGVDVLATKTAKSPKKRPYFVTIGTIEPRKNHALLLDIWETWRNDLDAPHLYIVGKRGWKNADVFARLDARPSNVTELNELSDEELAALTAGAAGVLQPSFAEGFGFPPAEAVALNVPVVCNELPVYREILGEIPVYAGASDMYLWIRTIEKLAEQKKTGCLTDQNPNFLARLPTWEAHFNVVLNLV